MINKIVFLLFLTISFSQGYNMQLLSNLTFGQNTSDITGFYQDGREFAVIGLQNAAAFVDVTDPYNPFEVGRISGGTSIWRDLKYWDRHVYIGTEAADGVKVVSVDNLDNPVLVNTITDFTNSHNVYIDQDGYLYVVGASSYAMWIYDLEDPSNPNLVGTWGSNDPGYTEYLHDITVFNDKVYGASIYEGFIYIIDVSDKSNPQTIQLNGQNYFDTGGGYISSHDTEVTPDEQYLFTGDENTGGHVKVWDISNYNNINLVAEYITDPNHSAHNLYYKDGLLFISYYADGTRVLDVEDPENPVEIAYYDTSNIEGLYVGNWGTYVYLPSGNIISSDIETGLYVLGFGGVSIIHSDVQDVDLNDSPYVVFQATVESFDGDVESVTLNYSLDNTNWDDVSMFENGNSNIYDAVMTFDDFDVLVNYYIEASSSTGQTSRYPQGDGYVSFIYGDLPNVVQDSFEQQSGWVVGDDSDNATTGIWELADPNGTYLYDSVVQPENDYSDQGTQCFVTGNAGGSSVGADDIDNGKTTLFSPVYDLSEFDDVLVSYWYWYSNNQGSAPGSEEWQVYVSNNAASSINPSWVPFQITSISTAGWQQYRSLLGGTLNLSSQVQFKFVAEDKPENDGCLVEAALDDFLIESIGSSSFTLGDLNSDSTVNILDVVQMVSIVIGELNPNTIQFSAGDINSDSFINVQDIVLLVNIVLNS